MLAEHWNYCVGTTGKTKLLADKTNATSAQLASQIQGKVIYHLTTITQVNQS